MVFSLLLLNMSAFCFLSCPFCLVVVVVGGITGGGGGSMCVSAQGACKALFCLSQSMKVSEPAHLSVKLLLSQQAPPLPSPPQVGAYRRTHTQTHTPYWVTVSHLTTRCMLFFPLICLVHVIINVFIRHASIRALVLCPDKLPDFSSIPSSVKTCRELQCLVVVFSLCGLVKVFPRVHACLCLCFWVIKSLMCMTDSPGVSMMSRRQPHPRRS